MKSSVNYYYFTFMYTTGASEAEPPEHSPYLVPYPMYSYSTSGIGSQVVAVKDEFLFGDCYRQLENEGYKGCIITWFSKISKRQYDDLVSYINKEEG